MQGLHTKVIVNPEAGSCSVRRDWPHISRRLQKAGLSFDYEFTEGTGQAIEIASRAINSGYNYLIAVGGDGTVNEVANGILRSNNSLNVILGIVSAGTAHALSFSLNVANDCKDINAYSFLYGQRRALIDVGVVQCWNRGKLIERFFLNEASTGFSADIVDAWESLPIRFGKNVNLALRTVVGYTSLATHRNKNVRLSVGNEVESIPICTVIVSNGRYCANKMLIAPHASFDDGLLNAIIVSNISKFKLLRIVPTLYTGSHIKYPEIRETKTDFVKIESDEHLLVEADGDIIGECPASFWVKPLALTVAIPTLHTN
jgi:YegS/Rv2252/BmrU family lipid kinase